MAIPTNGAVRRAQQERRETVSYEQLWRVLRIPVYMWLAFGVLRLVTCCKQPLTFLSNRHGSMAPTLSSGDVLLLTNYPNDPINVGDIVVVTISEDEQIVRRVVKVKDDDDGNLIFLIKGDNIGTIVAGTDEPIPEPLAPQWVSENDIVGKMILNIPLLGIPRLLIDKGTPHRAIFGYLGDAYLYCLLFALVAAGLSKLLLHL
ncbi:signal peptidase complex catalytic subunit SEC11A-like [Branchiostoma floridae]|uniref:Signal peptidase complex catalytic subunit SEC11 n=1 Tax=Branchiostoma floridae TaxID=7739 RepID=A0A9J7LDI7_BRAFL|nr:signal peptidase complex catalytic subunit SEC11A-like [Branchiostoma floridae]